MILNDDTKPEHIFVHLNHPCWEIDIWVLDEPDLDIPIARGQGYISLAELRELKIHINMLEERLKALEEELKECEKQSEVYEAYTYGFTVP